MISRTSKTYIENLLSQKKDWNILDIGCGYSANNHATTICDVQDLSSFYKNKNFVILKNNDLPFDDNQFDFVISSHVMEHVKDLKYFIKEIERVSKRGYIELPTKLEDNLVLKIKEHLWQMDFDDVNHKLLISKNPILGACFNSFNYPKNAKIF